MDLGYSGRRVLVVGASEGIGLSIARTMATEEAALLLVARNAERLGEVAQDIGKTSTAKPSFVAADVTKAGEAERLAEAVESSWGALDCLVSAVGGSQRAAFDELSDEDWIANYTFNVLSTVRVVRALLPALKRGQAPAIVLLGAASAKMPTAHQIVSNVHKAGLLGLVKTLASELAPDGIRINTVAPGRTLTRLWRDRAAGMAKERGVTSDVVIEEFARDIPMKRFATPEEVAVIVTWLGSPLASYVTGQHVNADGGLARGLL